MEITVKPETGDGNTHKLAIGGAMTIYGAAEAMGPLLEALQGCHELEIDLAEVAEMDTAGAQLLVLLRREALSAGKRLTLSGHSPAVLEVFDCYGLASFFGDDEANPEGKH